MLVYSEKIIAFIQEIKSTLKCILVNEVGLKVSGNRFYDKTQRHSFPIKIVIFNRKGKLGYFDPHFLELGFHQSVLYHSKELLGNLIRHELAHYLTFIEYGEDVPHHGNEFRNLCKNLHWGKNIYEATYHLDETAPVEKSSIARKIEKLLALGESKNPHESSLAIVKSRELLLKYNMTTSFESDEAIILKRIFKQKKMNAKIQCCGRILETFFVSIVYSYSTEALYLEIIGNAVNIEIAEYVASILDVELDRLWKLSGLKGISEKNSFFDGIAKGYCKKIENLNNSHNFEATNALMRIENTLIVGKSLIYPHLSQRKSYRKHCSHASDLGEKAGKDLEFKRGLNAPSKEKPLLEKV